MANQLSMALIDTILTLHQRDWSNRRIADELGIHRDTVAHYLRQAQAQAKPALAPTGSEDVEAGAKPALAPIGSEPIEAGAKPALAPIGSEPIEAGAKPALAPTGSEDVEAGAVPPPRGSGRPSDCEPWRAVILAQRELGLSAQRIFQDLVTDHGFSGSYYSVRRFVARQEDTPEPPFRRLECGPGEEAQIDFGTGAPIVSAEGKRQKT
jgi:hypothetical protein